MTGSATTTTSRSICSNGLKSPDVVVSIWYCWLSQVVIAWATAGAGTLRSW